MKVYKKINKKSKNYITKFESSKSPQIYSPFLKKKEIKKRTKSLSNLAIMSRCFLNYRSNNDFFKNSEREKYINNEYSRLLNESNIKMDNSDVSVTLNELYNRISIPLNYSFDERMSIDINKRQKRNEK